MSQGLTVKHWIDIYNPPANARQTATGEYDVFVDWVNYWQGPQESPSGCRPRRWVPVDEAVFCAYRLPLNPKVGFTIGYEICVMDRQLRWFTILGGFGKDPELLSGNAVQGEPVTEDCGPGH